MHKIRRSPDPKLKEDKRPDEGQMTVCINADDHLTLNSKEDIRPSEDQAIVCTNVGNRLTLDSKEMCVIYIFLHI